jgi:CDP-diacylglycerol--glycerol-3-phosphate 3-phosphatidyltransferase
MRSRPDAGARGHREPGGMSRGLYALKPWYTGALTGLRDGAARRGVSPNAVTAAGVVLGALAGTTLATCRPGARRAAGRGPAGGPRLAAAQPGRCPGPRHGRSTRWGAVCNEVGDRAAELAVLAGCFALAPAWLVLAAMAAASAPSWVALAGAAAGADRINGGPVGKTERCLLLVVVAAHAGARGSGARRTGRGVGGVTAGCGCGRCTGSSPDGHPTAGRTRVTCPTPHGVPRSPSGERRGRPTTLSGWRGRRGSLVDSGSRSRPGGRPAP